MFRNLWVFSPQTGRVELHDEDEHHPADVPTHQSIAEGLGEVGLSHGYAYTIPGGWRVLDFEHEPVGDPYVRRQVVETLRKQEHPPERLWAPSGAQATRFHYGRPVMSSVHTSDKLHGFLMNPKSRPDLQTPEGQRWLKYLRQQHTEKLDPLMPWLTREWKKGRLQHQQNSEFANHHPGHLYHEVESVRGGTELRRIHDDELDHWADFMQSDHPLRRGLGDIMQYQFPQFRERVDQWSAEMAAKAHDEALANARVVHTTPDGYTVQHLRTPEELKAEGDAMGHCVGEGHGYAEEVAAGRTLIYSLRDPEGKPHATVEIAPTRHHPTGYPPMNVGTSEVPRHVPDPRLGEPMPHNGEVVQIQGKANQTPNPEYQAQLKHWFASFPEEQRPQWQDQNHIDHIDQIVDPANYDDGYYDSYGQEGDYGLADARTIQYDKVLDSMLRENQRETYYDRNDGQGLYDYALKRGHIPQLAKAVEPFSEHQQSSFDHWRDMNFDQIPPYPDESAYVRPDGSPHQEAYEQALERYYEDEALWAEDHPGMLATNHMYSLLNPHFDGTAHQNAKVPQPPTV